MKKIPWWTIAAVAAGALLLYGQLGRFTAEGRDTPHSGQDARFDPSTARLIAAPAPAPPANTEKRVGPSDDALEVSQAVHAEATQTRAAAQAQANAPAY